MQLAFCIQGLSVAFPGCILGLGSDADMRMIEAHEQGLVEQFVAHAAVERPRIAVLHRLAGGDVMPVEPGLAALCQHRVAGQFSAIVAQDHA